MVYVPAAWLAPTFSVAPIFSVLEPATSVVAAPASHTKLLTVIVCTPLDKVIGALGIVMEKPLVPWPVTANTAEVGEIPPVGKLAPPVVVRPLD